MDIFERLKEIRKYRKLTQEKVAGWYGITKQSWGKKEKGQEGGLGPKEIQLFLEKTQMDPNYLFGQLDSLEEADLTKKDRPDFKSVQKALKDLQQKVQPIEKMDHVAERLMANRELYDLVKLMMYWDGSIIRRIADIVLGFSHGMDFEKQKARASPSKKTQAGRLGKAKGQPGSKESTPLLKNIPPNKKD